MTVLFAFLHILFWIVLFDAVIGKIVNFGIFTCPNDNNEDMAFNAKKLIYNTQTGAA